MAQFISGEQKAKILSAIKDEGMSIIDASKTYTVSEKTIRKWMKQQTKNAHTSQTEVQRLKQKIYELEAFIGKIVFEQDSKRKGPHGGY